MATSESYRLSNANHELQNPSQIVAKGPYFSADSMKLMGKVGKSSKQGWDVQLTETFIITTFIFPIHSPVLLMHRIVVESNHATPHIQIDTRINQPLLVLKMYPVKECQERFATQISTICYEVQSQMQQRKRNLG